MKQPLMDLPHLAPLIARYRAQIEAANAEIQRQYNEEKKQRRQYEREQERKQQEVREHIAQIEQQREALHATWRHLPIYKQIFTPPPDTKDLDAQLSRLKRQSFGCLSCLPFEPSLLV